MGVHGEIRTGYPRKPVLAGLMIIAAYLAGLWQVVHPVARPIALETLGNKRLAIDSSIWLYQL